MNDIVTFYITHGNNENTCSISYSAQRMEQLYPLWESKVQKPLSKDIKVEAEGFTLYGKKGTIFPDVWFYDLYVRIMRKRKLSLL